MDLRQFLSSTSVNPKQILKIVLSLSVILLVVWLFMVSRMELSGPGNSADPASIERADSIRTAINSNRSNREIVRSENEPNIFMNAVTTFIVLISILVVVWFLIRNKASGSSDQVLLFREMGEQPIGNGSQLKVVEINGEIWVLGLATGSVNLLHRYQSDEWKERKIHTPEREGGNFLDYFKSKL